MKHQGYIRSLFVAFCAFFVCVSAMAETTAEAAVVHLNPFAFKVGTMRNDDKTVAHSFDGGKLMNDFVYIRYYLNAPATKIVIRCWAADSEWQKDANINDTIAGYVVYDNPTNPRPKGIYTDKVDFTHIIGLNPNAREANVRWTVDVEGGNTASEYTAQQITYYKTSSTTGSVTYTAKISNAKEVTQKRRFVNPTSIVIDDDPFSDNFGMIYCAESRLAVTGTGPTYTAKSASEQIQYDSYWGTTSKADGGAGLYVFDPAFQVVTPAAANYDFVENKADKDRTIGRGYNMGWIDRDVSANIQKPLHTLYNGTNTYIRPMGPRKIRLTEDKKYIYVTGFNTRGKILYRGDVKRLSHQMDDGWVTTIIATGSNGLVLDGTDKEPDISESYDQSVYNVETSSNTFVAGPNIAFDIYGTGDNMKAIMVSGHKWGISPYLAASYRCDEYNLGTNTSWAKAPSKTDWFNRVGNTGNTVHRNRLYYNTATQKPIPFITAYEQVAVEYDQNGGFWMTSIRGNHTEMASLIHFNADKTITFAEYWADRQRGALKYNNDYTKLLVAGGPFTVKWTNDSRSKKGLTAVNGLYGHPAATAGWSTIYTVDKNEVNNSHINTNTSDYRTYMSSTTSHRNAIFKDSVYINFGMFPEDCDWDYANNLYVVAGTDNEYIKAFAMPNGGKPVSTPCFDKHKFQLSPVRELSVTVNPTNYATIRHIRINRAPYGHYLQNANIDLIAENIPTGCKFYQWTGQSTGTTSGTDGCKLLINSLTKNETITANVGLCVYEDTKILGMTSETIFPAAFVQRELDDVSYSTICLPFNLTTLEGTPYEGASVLKFDKAEDSKVAGDNRTFLTFKEVTFTNGDIMEAGKPYLIKVNTPIAKGAEKIFKNVTCPPIGTQGQSVTHNGVTFYGLLNPTTFTAAQLKDMLFLTADNRLVTLYGQSSVNINGLRGYFTVSGDMAKTAEFVLNLPEKVTTSIPMVNLADSLQVTKYLWNGQIYIQRGNEVYDLSGARVK